MRGLLYLVLFVCLPAPIFSQTPLYWITDTPGNWEDGNNWSTGSNGTPCACIPGVNNKVIFDSNGRGNCTINASVEIFSMTISSYSTIDGGATTGVINLGTNDLDISGSVDGTGAAATNIFGSGQIISSTGELHINRNNTVFLTVVTFAGTRFDVAVFSKSENLFLNGSVFNRAATLNKVGDAFSLTHVSNISQGGNIFNGPVSISCANCTGLYTSASSVSLIFGNSNADIFNDNITISANGDILLAHNSATNQFNGDITCLGNARILFCEGSSAAKAQLAAGKAFNMPNAYNGHLSLKRFTLLGSNSKTFTFKTTQPLNSRLVIGPGTIVNGDLTYTGGNLTIDGAGGTTFNGKCTFDVGYVNTAPTVISNPIFNGDVTIISNRSPLTGPGPAPGPGPVWASGIFKGDFSYTQNGSLVWGSFGTAGSLCEFAGNIFINTPATHSLFAKFIGSGQQNLLKSVASATPTFSAFLLDKTGGWVTLTYPLTVNIVNFNGGTSKGIINTDLTNFLQINSFSGTADHDSHVNGPLRRTGSGVPTTFPVGNGSIYGGLTISAASSTTFEASYIATSAKTAHPSMTAPIVAVSDCEYWRLRRIAPGTASPNVTLNWTPPNSERCTITNTSHILLAQYVSGSWISKGGSATTGTLNGSVTNTSPIDFDSGTEFAVASNSLSSPLPIKLSRFYATATDNVVILNWETASELNNHYFEIQRSQNGIAFDSIAAIEGAGTTNSLNTYEYIDHTALPGHNYYRLRQTDYDGTVTISDITRITVSEPQQLATFPNPVTNGIVYLNYEGIFSIFNSQGKLVFRSNKTRVINISSLDFGLHTIIDPRRGFQSRILISK